MNDLHPSFWAALAGWFLAQSIKMISCFIGSGKLDFSYLPSTGGMPSAHSAMACSLATSIGIHEGFQAYRSQLLQRLLPLLCLTLKV